MNSPGSQYFQVVSCTHDTEGRVHSDWKTDDSPLSSAKLRATHGNENEQSYGPFSIQDLIGAIAGMLVST